MALSLANSVMADISLDGSISLGFTPTSGNLLVGLCYGEIASFSTASGWTLFHQDTYFTIQYKISGGSETAWAPSNFTCQETIAAVVEVSGWASTPTAGNYSVVGETATDLATNSISADGDLVLAILDHTANDTTETGSPSNSFTQLNELNNHSANAGSCAVAYRLNAGSGSFSTTLTGTNSGTSRNVILAFNDGASAPDNNAIFFGSNF